MQKGSCERIYLVAQIFLRSIISDPSIGPEARQTGLVTAAHDLGYLTSHRALSHAYSKANTGDTQITLSSAEIWVVNDRELATVGRPPR